MSHLPIHALPLSLHFLFHRGEHQTYFQVQGIGSRNGVVVIIMTKYHQASILHSQTLQMFSSDCGTFLFFSTN